MNAQEALETRERLRAMAQFISENQLRSELRKAMREYEFPIAQQMVAAGCKQVELRKRFGGTIGQVYWCQIKGLRNPHKNYRK